MLANLWALRRHLPRRFFSIRDFRDRLSQDEAPESAALSYDELPCCDGNAPLDTDRYRVALAWLPNGSGICLDACSAHPRIDVRQRVTAAGYEYLPIDAREFDGVRREDLTALSFADDSISCILSVDTVEHIPHWRAAVNEMFRVLRPGGTAIIHLPCYFFDRPTGKPLPFSDKWEHVRQFAARELLAAYKAAGFMNLRTTMIFDYGALASALMKPHGPTAPTQQ